MGRALEIRRDFSAGEQALTRKRTADMAHLFLLATMNHASALGESPQ